MHGLFGNFEGPVSFEERHEEKKKKKKRCEEKQAFPQKQNTVLALIIRGLK